MNVDSMQRLLKFGADDFVLRKGTPPSIVENKRWLSQIVAKNNRVSRVCTLFFHFSRGVSHLIYFRLLLPFLFHILRGAISDLTRLSSLRTAAAAAMYECSFMLPRMLAFRKGVLN